MAAGHDRDAGAVRRARGSAADALNVIGAVGDVAAHRVLAELTAALAARSMVLLRVLDGVPMEYWHEPISVTGPGGVAWVFGAADEELVADSQRPGALVVASTAIRWWT